MEKINLKSMDQALADKALDIIPIVEHYKKLLPAQDLIITGSYALAQYGLIKKGPRKDLDLILVKPSEEAKKVLETLREPAPENYPPRPHHYRIKDPQTMIDIFVSESPEEYLCIGDQKYAMILHIVKAKKAYKSLKQTLQLQKIAEQIFKDSDLTDVLNILKSQIK